jgi:hypothetical protein
MMAHAVAGKPNPRGANAPCGFLRIMSSQRAASWLLSARLNSPSRPADRSASVLLPHEEYRTGRLGPTGEVRPVVVIEVNCLNSNGRRNTSREKLR